MQQTRDRQVKVDMSDTAESSVHDHGDPYRQSQSASPGSGSSAPQPPQQYAHQAEDLANVMKVTRGTSCVLCRKYLLCLLSAMGLLFPLFFFLSC